MKIVMIGNTNVGKTTYMASLYGIMQQQIEGFSLKAVNGNDRSRLHELAQAI
jgi:GTPase SAR1 family protein